MFRINLTGKQKYLDKILVRLRTQSLFKEWFKGPRGEDLYNQVRCFAEDLFILGLHLVSSDAAQGYDTRTQNRAIGVNIKIQLIVGIQG